MNDFGDDAFMRSIADEFPPRAIEARAGGRSNGSRTKALFGASEIDVEAAALVHASPYVWRDPRDIPPREWLYGRHLIRKFVSVTVAPGGLGKTALKTVEGLAMVTGRDLLNVGVPSPLTAWLYNLEDPADEIERRIAAACLHHGIEPADIANRLFSDSGRETPLLIAEGLPTGGRIIKPVTDALIAELIARQIDVLIIDPFVSCHTVSENDNGAMDLVAKEWGRVADRANCAIELVHHSRKLNGVEATAESSRGAIALVAAARSVMTLNRMTEAEGSKIGIDPEDRARLFRAYADKANLAPPMEKSDWYRLASVDLTNGDWVGVVERYYLPDPFMETSIADLDAVQRAVTVGEYRESPQASEWVGNVVASIMGIDLDGLGARNAVLGMIKTWLKNGSLQVVERLDAKRMRRKFIEAGARISPDLATPEKVGRGKVGQRCKTDLPHRPTPFRVGGGGAGQSEGATPAIDDHAMGDLDWTSKYD